MVSENMDYPSANMYNSQKILCRFNPDLNFQSHDGSLRSRMELNHERQYQDKDPITLAEEGYFFKGNGSLRELIT